jgi:hypothetical protein
MGLHISVGDTIKVDQTYVNSVLSAVPVPTPTHFQTVQSLNLLRDETAKVLGIGYISIDGDFYTTVHVAPTNTVNVLHRNGKGTKIFFRHPEYITNAIVKC